MSQSRGVGWGGQGEINSKFILKKKKIDSREAIKKYMPNPKP